MSHTDDEERKVAKDLAREIENDMDRERDLRIVNLRIGLHTALKDADLALKDAQGVYRRLCAPDVYDVEYADCGHNFEKMLEQAEVSLAATRALMPSDGEGNTRPAR